MDLLRFFRHEPVLTALVTFCALLIGGVMLSDWLEKRRTRQLIKLRDDLKEQNRNGARAPESKPPSRPRPAGFRIFRWEFVFVSVLFIAVWIPFSRKHSVQIHAKGRIESAPAPVAVSSPAPRNDPAPAVNLPPPLVTLTVSHPQCIPGKVRLRLLDFEKATDVAPQSESSPLGSLRKSSTELRAANVAALFEEFESSEESSAVEQTAALSPRDIYPIGNGGFAPAGPGGRMALGRR